MKEIYTDTPYTILTPQYLFTMANEEYKEVHPYAKTASRIYFQ